MNSDYKFVEYDDSNLEHVMAGPDYGQTWGDGWSLEDNFEYIYQNRYAFKSFNFKISLST